MWKSAQIIGTAIVAVVALMMQIKPNDAKSNLSEWLALFTDNVPRSLISPTVDKWVLVALFVLGCLIWLGPIFYRRLRGSPSPASHLSLQELGRSMISTVEAADAWQRNKDAGGWVKHQGEIDAHLRQCAKLGLSLPSDSKNLTIIRQYFHQVGAALKIGDPEGAKAAAKMDFRKEAGNQKVADEK